MMSAEIGRETITYYIRNENCVRHCSGWDDIHDWSKINESEADKGLVTFHLTHAQQEKSSRLAEVSSASRLI